MGIDLYWRPKAKHTVFHNCRTSDMAIKIRDTFGPHMSEDDLVKLRHFYEATGDEIYKEMIDVIEQHGDIVIETE